MAMTVRKRIDAIERKQTAEPRRGTPVAAGRCRATIPIIKS
jgi:hypothetical protein